MDAICNVHCIDIPVTKIKAIATAGEIKKNMIYYNYNDCLMAYQSSWVI